MFTLTLATLPFWLLIVYAFGFGVVIGSFLNVYIYRFHTGKSLSGHSHCLSCGTPLRPYELIPLVSYVALRGKCRTCGCKIPPRYFLVELLTGLLFVGATMLTTDLVVILLLWFLFSVIVIITVYDLYHFIIPDSLTLATLSGVGLLKGYEWFLGQATVEVLVYDLLAALGGAFFLFALWYGSKGKWIGFGDVKLAVPLGLWVGYTSVFSFIVLSFWIGAIISLAIIGVAWLVSRGQAHLQNTRAGLTIKSAVPFAPFLVMSCLAILFTQFNVLSLFSSL